LAHLGHRKKKFSAESLDGATPSDKGVTGIRPVQGPPSGNALVLGQCPCPWAVPTHSPLWTCSSSTTEKTDILTFSGLVSEELLLSLRIHFSSKNNNL
jgi:hypothetical protein